MLILSEADVRAVLPMRDVITAVENALHAQAAGRTVQPVRSVVRSADGFFGSMPCSIEGVGLGAKLVTFFPNNGKRDLHTHHALIATLDPQTGRPAAVLDGRLITEMRTAATSAIATKALALDGAGTVAILGTGVQARAHIEALRVGGMLREVRIWGRTPANAEKLRRWAQEQNITARIAGSVADACRGAHVVCTVTPAQAPILESYDVEPGTHVNAVGSSSPAMQELATALVGRSRLFVDTIEGAMHESGDILAAIQEGSLPAQPELTPLCDVVAGKTPGRRVRDEITIFKSLGMAIEDIACAALVVERAQAKGVGSVFAL